VLVAPVTKARVSFTTRPSFVLVVSKFVPVTVNVLPAIARLVLTEEIVGAFTAATVNGVALDADPPGATTFTAPVLAPAGTVTISSPGNAEETVAAVPLNLTVSWL
jgi:hypothetical protein